MSKIKNFAKRVLLLMPINHTEWGTEGNENDLFFNVKKKG